MQKAGISDYQLFVGKQKTKRKQDEAFNDDWADIRKWKSGKANSEQSKPKTPPLTRRNTRSPSTFNVKEEQQLFPMVENGLYVQNKDRLFFFRLVFRCSGKTDLESPRRFKKITRMVPHFYRQPQISDQVSNNEAYQKVS